jgi:hypothetical protein
VWNNKLVARHVEGKVTKLVIPRVLVPWVLRKCHDDPVAGVEFIQRIQTSLSNQNVCHKFNTAYSQPVL